MLDNKIKKGNEYQLTDALELMRSEENSFGVSVVDEWMDCGNVPSTLETNKVVLSKNEFESKTKKSLYNTVFIEPVYVGENVVVTDSVIGPYVSIENNVNISGSLISNSIIKDNAVVENALFHYSCIGANAIVKGGNKKLDISDFSKICE